MSYSAGWKHTMTDPPAHVRAFELDLPLANSPRVLTVT